ncbi:MAG: hypothetical protein CVV42_11880 [Candidatus Riflebacteria bacterium HGW-Riflebacteria-2]|jgi:hypothetical protein|nr:MAG: hypothetical protein CVV42_11880 [Candidatus Riflebacteria bacterium HGW-Riflebacteria-2]
MKSKKTKRNPVFAAILATVILLTLTRPLVAQNAKAFDITSRFKLWLLNNEARAMSSLKADGLLVERVNSPFALMPFNSSPAAMAEERLWAMHYKFYVLLDEIQEIYAFAKTYGSGRFGILFKQHRPEIWGVMPLQAALPGLVSITAVEYRKAFHAALLKALSLDASRDVDLSARLQKAVKKLSDEEFRLLDDYLNTFSALFPGDPTATMISTFIESGSKKQFAAALKDFLYPVFTAPVFTDINISEAPVEPDDPLAELEKLTGGMAENATNEQTGAATDSDEDDDDNTQAGETQTTPTSLEPPPPGTEDLFKIWD